MLSTCKNPGWPGPGWMHSLGHWFNQEDGERAELDIISVRKSHGRAACPLAGLEVTSGPEPGRGQPR